MTNVLEINCETGEVMTRAMTKEELAAQAASAALAKTEADARAKIEADTEAARLSAVSKLATLGLTKEEIAALVK